jgi:YbbR domain-containing protein
MNDALRQLLNNLSSVVLALLLAVTIWIVATMQADPFNDQEYLSVPVAALGQPENTVFFEGDAARVNITVRASQSVLDGLSASDFVATMDLSAVQPGTPTSVPISVSANSEQVRIRSYSPQMQSVHLEELSTTSFPAAIVPSGEPATGYLSVAPVVTPREVTVSGPLPYLAQVTSVSGSVDIGGARENVEEMVAIAPRDAEGNVVTGLQWSPEQVQVLVGVRRRVGYKPDVQVIPDVRGDPADGYRRGSVIVEPSTVTLAGPAATLNEMPGFVETLPISITGATQILTQRVPVTLPTNVVVVGINLVTVTVEILPILSSRTMTDVVEVQGLSRGWVATLSPGVVEVILEGPDSLLAEIVPEDLQVFVNLFGYGLGTHAVAPVVLSPQGIEVVTVIPESIEVVIQLPPTVVPTSTLTLEGG